jgi:uncharacterized protein YjlB
MDIMGMILWIYDIFDYHYYHASKKMKLFFIFTTAALLFICGIYFDKLDQKENGNEK